MRDRLIELLEAEGCFSRYMTDDERRAKLADHLLAEGVIVPPAKIGQTVFRIVTMGTGVKKKSVTHELSGFCVVKYKETQKRFIRDIEVTKNNFIDVCESYGKTVFLTREEAEKALAERSENGKA